MFCFQKHAIEALKEGDLQSFTDLVNSKDVEEELDNPNFWSNRGTVSYIGGFGGG